MPPCTCAYTLTQKLLRGKCLVTVYQNNSTCEVCHPDLFFRVKTLQAQLAERDAMIAVMQKHSSMSRASSISSLLYSPVHSPRPSLSASLTSSSSAPVSSPPSGASSRQSSQLDTSTYRETRPPMHSKSSKPPQTLFPQVKS